MDSQEYEQSFQKALAILAKPAVYASELTSATQAAVLLQGITLLAACVIDSSLDNEKTKKAIKLFKITESFEAFRVSDRAMLNIKINLEEIPHIMTSMVTAFVKAEDKDSTYLMNLQMKNISELLKNCTQQAKNARQAFSDALPLIQEMQQVAFKLPQETHEYSMLMKVFGEVEEHWSVLLDSFSTIESFVIGPITRSLNASQIIQDHQFRGSRLIRDMLAESVFRAAALSLNIARSAGIYNQVSKKYVMPLIAESIGKLTMSKEEAKSEFSKIKRITKESKKFSEEKLLEADREAFKRILHFNDELKAVLMPSNK